MAENKAMIEEFLIKEFEQQHENIREINSLTFQKVQFFINLETFILGAALTIFSFGIKEIIYYFFVLTGFLAFLGHTIFITTVHSIAQEIALDFVNNLIRIYFKKNYSDKAASKYIYFAKYFEQTYGSNILNSHASEIPTNSVQDRWKEHRDPSVFISKFVGNINSMNITITVYGMLLSLLNIYQLNINPYYILPPTIILGLFIRKIYFSVFFDNKLDQIQNKLTSEWINYLRSENIFQ